VFARRPRRQAGEAPNPSKEASMKIPDTLEGALILSLIDFVLSFVVIAGIGVVLSLFPLLNRLGRLEDRDLRKGE
jgi:hypothetical protein